MSTSSSRDSIDISAYEIRELIPPTSQLPVDKKLQLHFISPDSFVLTSSTPGDLGRPGWVMAAPRRRAILNPSTNCSWYRDHDLSTCFKRGKGIGLPYLCKLEAFRGTEVAYNLNKLCGMLRVLLNLSLKLNFVFGIQWIYHVLIYSSFLFIKIQKKN